MVGFVDIPIVHMSVVWWRSLHQPATVIQPGQPSIAPIMLVTLLWATLAFTILYAYLLAFRMRVGRLETKAMSAAFLPGSAPEPAEIEAHAVGVEAVRG